MFFRTQDLSLVRKGICFGEGKVGGSFGCSDDSENRDVGEGWAGWAVWADQLTVSQPDGADFPPLNYVCPPTFWWLPTPLKARGT